MNPVISKEQINKILDKVNPSMDIYNKPYIDVSDIYSKHITEPNCLSEVTRLASWHFGDDKNRCVKIGDKYYMLYVLLSSKSNRIYKALRLLTKLEKYKDVEYVSLTEEEHKVWLTAQDIDWDNLTGVSLGRIHKQMLEEL